MRLAANLPALDNTVRHTAGPLPQSSRSAAAPTVHCEFKWDLTNEYFDAACVTALQRGAASTVRCHASSLNRDREFSFVRRCTKSLSSSRGDAWLEGKALARIRRKILGV